MGNNIQIFGRTFSDVSSITVNNTSSSAVKYVQEPNLSSITIKPENCASSSTQITPESYICETDSSYPGTVILMSSQAYCDIGSYLDNNIKIELNKTYHCIGQLFIKWNDDDTEEYYYIDSDFNASSYNTSIDLNSFTWEGSTGATQTFNFMRLNMSTGNGYKTMARLSRSGSITKSGVLLPGSFYRITQVDTNGYDTINLDFNNDPRFIGIYKSLAYRSMIASSAQYVSEWCNSLSSFTTQQFAGQPFSGDFTFNNIKSITYYAFGSVNTGTETGNWGYFRLNFPSCSSIYNAAFISNQYLQSVSFPECTIIGNQAFQNCKKLATISFPECTSIGNYVFSSCHSLTTASFPECTSIGSCAFYSCSNLTTASFSKCTSIGSYAFCGCSNLTTISFPECTSIGSYAFSSCHSLTTISFPSCTSLGNYAFSNCSNLTIASFPKCTSIGSYAFYNCSNLTTIFFPSCTYIGNSAFQYCSNLTTASFPKCTSIGNYAFYNCSNLTTMSFPLCTTISGGATFSNCAALQEAYFPECILISGQYVFGNCTSLSIISFPKVSSISAYVFAGCKSLESAYFMGSSIPLIGTGIFNITPMVSSSYLGYFGSIYVPSSLLASYKTATNWTAYSSRMVGI